MNDLNLRAARIQLYGLIAAVIFAIIIALGITSGAFVLSFAVLRDLALQAGIPARWSWLLPLIIDGAILGSTIAAVALSKITGNDNGRSFFVALLVAVVCISVVGNAYHAYRAAETAARAVAAGTYTGAMPLSPTGAALIAVIPPLLVLAFTHGIGLLIKGIGNGYGEYNALVRDATAEASATGSATDAALEEASPRIAEYSALHQDSGVHEEDNAIEGAQCDAGDVAVGSSLVSGRETEASAPGLDPNLNEHVTQILDFVDHSPDLDDSVRDAARRKILNPHLTFATIAEETGVVASTAQRRYKRAEAAAIAAGIAMPQQPDLGEHTLLDDHLDNEQVRELVTS